MQIDFSKTNRLIEWLYLNTSAQKNVISCEEKKINI